MSAFIVGNKHLSYMIRAASAYSRRYGPFRWFTTDPREESDYQRGEPWGPSHVANIQERERTLTRENRDAVGCMLAATNRESVNHRYDENEIEELFSYDMKAETLMNLDPVVVLKATRCYMYQSCEHPEWETSSAKAFCEALIVTAISKLDGYDNAPWAID
jgi:hypothetical protein